MEGEAGVAPPAEHCTAHRHDASRAAYQAGCRCAQAVQANRDYYREYNRLGREVASWRARQNEHARRYQERRRANPETHAQLLEARRNWRAARKEREQKDARRLVDPVVVQRLINGEPAQPNRPERLEAVRILRDRDLSYDDIAARLGVHPRQVHRDLAGLGLTAHEQRGDVA